MIEKETSAIVKETIQNALKKIQSSKEKDLCKYLPGSGGYMHHFTMKKIMKHDPVKFRSLIEEFIINPPVPRVIDPKPRARRKDLSKVLLKETEILDILKLAKETGDSYLIAKLKNQIPLQKIKKELIKSIRKNRLEEHLWRTYVEIIGTQN